MPKVEWSDSLSVGIDTVDEQHKALIDRLNAVSKAVQEHHGESEIVRTLGFLIDYTHFHFDDEEGHMQQNAYPYLEEHRKQHRHFKETLADLKQDYEEEGATHELSEAINTFLWTWLVNHIEEVDRTYGNFLAQKREAQR